MTFEPLCLSDWLPYTKYWRSELWCQQLLVSVLGIVIFSKSFCIICFFGVWVNVWTPNTCWLPTCFYIGILIWVRPTSDLHFVLIKKESFAATWVLHLLNASLRTPVSVFFKSFRPFSLILVFSPMRMFACAVYIHMHVYTDTHRHRHTHTHTHRHTHTHTHLSCSQPVYIFRKNT